MFKPIISIFISIMMLINPQFLQVPSSSLNPPAKKKKKGGMLSFFFLSRFGEPEGAGPG